MKDVTHKNSPPRERGVVIKISTKDWGAGTNINELNNITLKKGLSQDEVNKILEKLADRNNSHED